MAIMPPAVPFPDLRIVGVDQLLPHEQHDSQRSGPLQERIKQADVLTNPPIVAPIDEHTYVILDGSNRFHSFSALGYRHILVQVTPYNSNEVDLGVWQHIISHWETDELMSAIEQIPGIHIESGWNSGAVAQILMQDGRVIFANAASESAADRNALLRDLVATYQTSATLYRTAISDPIQIWELYPKAVAIVLFKAIYPEDIIEAATEQAFLPPGVSRHLVQGRALMVNYPLERLLDNHTSLEEKNNALKSWLKERLAHRSVRFYAESTYQFNE